MTVAVAAIVHDHWLAAPVREAHWVPEELNEQDLATTHVEPGVLSGIELNLCGAMREMGSDARAYDRLGLPDVVGGGRPILLNVTVPIALDPP
jgi:hypothetical protein